MRNGRNYNQRCPWCDESVDPERVFNDVLEVEFKFLCPHCDRQIQVQVESRPIFELSKPESPEEYAARRAVLIARIDP